MATKLVNLDKGTGTGIKLVPTTLLSNRVVGNTQEYSLVDSIQNYDLIMIRFSHSSTGYLQDIVTSIPALIPVSSSAVNCFSGRHVSADNIWSDYQCGFTANNKFKVGYLVNVNASYPLYVSIIGINLYLTNTP